MSWFRATTIPSRMSALCHNQTHAVQQTVPAIDHLVGAGEDSEVV